MKKRRWPTLVAAIAVALLATAGTVPANAADSHQLISGDGSSWATNAINVWVAGVTSSGLQVVWTSNGSAQGRKDFGNGTNDFAVSDIGYQGTDPHTGAIDLPCKLGNGNDCRPYAYLPIVAGGTSFPYHLTVAGQLVRNLRLSGETLAKIFTGGITNWNDPAITKDNNGRQFPSIPIIPITHQEGSGSTAQFTLYLDQQYPSIWRPYAGGPGETEYYPHKVGIAQNGSDQIINYITSAAANGSIGYDEYSYALAKNYPVAKIENAAGNYTLPTQYNVAVALQKAQINTDKTSPNYLLQNLTNVYTDPDPRTYALSSYSYMIIPTSPTDSRMSTAKRQKLAHCLYYSNCQGQGLVGQVGYSSLPLNLVQASFDQTAKLKVADPKVDLTKRDVTSCNNPTFVPGNLSANHLAQIAPAIPACDHTGAGPCSGAGYTGVGPTSNSSTDAQGLTPNGGANPSAANASNAPGGGAAGQSGGAPGKTKPGTAANPTATGAPKIDPANGQPINDASNGGSGGAPVTGVPTELAAYRQKDMSNVLAPLAVLEMLAVLVLPPVFYFYVLRRRRSRS
ncbi:MAG: phosphate transporter substrate-binding protein PhoT family [Frankiales bacterium]|nr:phosphate transporter substrate-binding protein PhoT family [Frankiales bacterium]